MPAADNQDQSGAKQDHTEPNRDASSPNGGPGNRNASVLVGRLGETGKITAVLAIMAIAFWFVSKKLKNVTWSEVQQGFDNLPVSHIIVAILLTVLNYVILTGYDWIAIRHLKKKLPFSRMMSGAVVGYSSGNVLGWLFGGNIVRYRMYSRWGFSTLEIVALVSILSITFWLGLFLLAGVAFLVLPVHLPDDVLKMLTFETKLWGHISFSQKFLGGIFLGFVGAYLIACLLIRQPIRFRDFSVSLPPFRLSSMQLIVSAGDFLLATATLYALLPPDIVGPDKINFSTVLIAYLTAQIAAVLTHVPGGYGLLEVILLTFLEGPDSSNTGSIVCAVILFRLIYYFLPFMVAVILFVINEYATPLSRTETNDGG
jgi:uncharacterized membrane protein YbhN (UPF0104 family)